jgi:signal transduction histidine kinase
MQSIKFKILTAFLVVIAVLFISEVFFVFMHFATIKRYQDITDNMISEYQVIENTTNLINSFNNLVKYASDKDRINNYNGTREILLALLAKLDKTITNPESQIAYLGLKNTVSIVLTDCDNGVAQVFQGNFVDITNNYNAANHQNYFVQQNTATLILKELKYTESLRAEITRTQALIVVIGLIFFALVMLSCVWYSFSFSRRLILPLTKLTRLAKIIEKGNLNATVEADLLAGSDEVASLANSFNTMVGSLRSNIKQLREYNQALIKTKRIVVDRESRISQLQDINRMKDEFMNIVTHELKTPLIPIVGLSEVMGQKKETLSPEFQGYVDIIHDESVRLTKLIKQILAASRSGNLNQEKPLETFKLDEFILAQQLPLNEVVKRTNSRVEFKIAEKDITITSDREKISQVIYNLVDNAVKYGPNGQTITIALSRTDNKMAKIEVIDQGKGIPQELQEMLFVKFSQLEPSASRSQDGMGLGLYICKQNIGSLGGRIFVKSEVGHGSDFYFTLPLEYSPKENKEVTQDENQAAKQAKKPAGSKKKSV